MRYYFSDDTNIFVSIIAALLWIFLSFVVAYGAKNRGHAFRRFLILSLLTTPIIGAFVLFVLGENPVSSQKLNIETTLLSSYKAKKCPFCAELVRSEAKICRYCGKEFEEK